MSTTAEIAEDSHIAFHGTRVLTSGDLRTVASAVRQANTGPDDGAILVIDNETGQWVDIDTSGDDAAFEARYPGARAPEAVQPEPAPAGRGRPKLGVVGKEVTLLPRHWAWLETQRGGASGTLRRLVDAARKSGASQDRIRRAQDRTNRFMSVMAGDQQGFEEATRALYAGNLETFRLQTKRWPKDIVAHAMALSQDAFQ